MKWPHDFLKGRDFCSFLDFGVLLERGWDGGVFGL
jgi:hypothetical protein